MPLGLPDYRPLGIGWRVGWAEGKRGGGAALIGAPPGPEGAGDRHFFFTRLTWPKYDNVLCIIKIFSKRMRVMRGR